jgi:glycosyltransferase involved in cell wall biosynthesis
VTVLSLHTPVQTVGAIDSRVDLRDPATQQIARLERRLFEESDGLLANTPSVVGEIEKRYHLLLRRDRLATIAHGLLDVDDSADVEPENENVNILFVGRFERRKGIDILLRALPSVLAAVPSARCTLVGNDALEASCGVSYRSMFAQSPEGKRFADRVSFTGIVPEEDLPGYYARCDIFVAPSRYESFGLVVLEAMRAGKPVVASRVGGMTELVEPGRNGVLVTPEDSQELAEALVGLALDPKRRAAYGSRSRELFVTRYSAARMAQETESFYRSLVARSARGAAGVIPPQATDR